MEIVATLRSHDEDRDADLRGLLEDAPQADLRSALRVIVDALNIVGPNVAPIAGENAALALFKRLPKVPLGGRKAASSHVAAARRAWYREAFWAWRQDRL